MKKQQQKINQIKITAVKCTELAHDESALPHKNDDADEQHMLLCACDILYEITAHMRTKYNRYKNCYCPIRAFT